METLTNVKTEPSIRIVQKAFTDFLNGNIPGILDACTGDVVWSSFDNPGVPFGKTFQGKNGVADFFTALGNSVDYTNFEPREFFASADRVFVKGYHKAKVKATGKFFGHEFLMEFRLQDGKIGNFFAWIDTRDEAAAFM
jgi:ketosteroid isomerase-like protein